MDVNCVKTDTVSSIASVEHKTCLNYHITLMRFSCIAAKSRFNMKVVEHILVVTLQITQFYAQHTFEFLECITSLSWGITKTPRWGI